MSLSAVDLRRAAMDLLARREHSRRELHDKLRRRFGDEATDLLDAVLDELIDQGLQSDQRFAESFVHSRLHRRQGPLRVRQEMLLRGIEPALMSTALAAVDAEQWLAAARDALCSRFGDDAPADRKEWARRARFLQGRGFNPGQIHSALDAD